MDHNTQAIIGSAILLIGYLALLWLLVYRYAPPFARKLIIILTGIEIILGIFHILIWSPIAPFWQWFLDLHMEKALGTTFSAIQLMALGLTAGFIGFFGPFPKLWQRLFWFMLAAAFIFLNLDEYYLIHEGFHASGYPWQIAWGAGGMALVIASALAYWYGFRSENRFFLWLFGGLAVIGFAGIGLDFVIQEMVCPENGVGCHRYMLIEEFLEMAGVTIVFVAVVAYAEERLSKPTWHKVWRWTSIGATLWAIWLVSSLWFIPSIESSLLGQPSQVLFREDTLELTTYRITHSEIRPGDAVGVGLYFQANDFLDRDYYVSLHLFSYPEVESIAQADLLLGQWDYPSRGWIPGLEVRNWLWLDIPEDLETHRSYQLIAHVWDETWDNGIPISHTEFPLFDETTVILAELPAFTQDTLPAHTGETYVFDPGFTLAAYEVPEAANAGEAITLDLWWDVTTPSTQHLTQYFHLIDADGENVFGYDQPPFNGQFATHAWHEDMKAQDQWTFTLPEDLEAGTYTLYTGLYDSESITRVTVHHADGSPVEHNSIPLGEITITAP